MRAITIAFMFTIVGLISSYMVFGTIRGSYIKPGIMIGSLVEQGPVGRRLVGRLLGIQERASKILILTGISCVLGFGIGIITKRSNSKQVYRPTPTSFIIDRYQRTRKINNWVRLIALIVLIILLYNYGIFDNI